MSACCIDAIVNAGRAGKRTGYRVGASIWRTEPDRCPCHLATYGCIVLPAFKVGIFAQVFRRRATAQALGPHPAVAAGDRSPTSPRIAQLFSRRSIPLVE